MSNSPTPNAEERVHHPYSPSQLQSLEACPCYVGRDSKHARTIAGTLAHKVVETREDDDRLSDEDAASAASCVDFIETRKKIVQEMFPGGPVRELKETYLPIDDLEFEDCKGTTAGFVDNVLLSFNLVYAEMADWKFGYWDVEHAENNLQAVAYMLGLFKLFPALQRIRFFFKLPNINGFSETEINRADFASFYLRIQVIVARAREGRAAAVRGDWSKASPMSPLCSFCGNIGKCEAVASLMINVARKYHAIEVPEDISASKLLNSRDTGAALRLAQLAKAWADGFRSRVHDRVLCGQSDLPEGFHISTNPGRREVADAVKFRAIALQYISEEDYSKVVPVPGFGEIEAAISDITPRGSKEAAVKQFAKDLEASGATVRGDPYSFLKATNSRERTKAEKQQQNIESNKT